MMGQPGRRVAFGRAIILSAGSERWRCWPCRSTGQRRSPSLLELSWRIPALGGRSCAISSSSTPGREWAGLLDLSIVLCRQSLASLAATALPK